MQGGGVVGPAAAEVGPTPFSQPWAALQAQLGIQLQMPAAAQLSFCKCFPGAISVQAEGTSPQGQAGTRCVLGEGARCPCLQEKCNGESEALPFGRMVLFAITKTQSCKKRKASPDRTGTKAKALKNT